jgi:Fe-S cluster assembly scaffold IscU
LKKIICSGKKMFSLIFLRPIKTVIKKLSAYTDAVIEHDENPQNVGSFLVKDPDIGTGFVGALACGDVMKLQIKVDKTGTIVDSKFKTFGCRSAISSSSFASELIKGKKLEEALLLKNQDISSHLKLPPAKLHCSIMVADAIKAAIKDYKTKRESPSFTI